MKIQRTVLDEGVACLTLTGEFDAFAANPFLEQIEAIAQAGVVHVVGNLRLVLFMNSTAVGSLIKARKRLRGLGGDMVLSDVSPRAKETLDMLGLGQVLKSYAGDDEAARALRAAMSTDQVNVPADNAVFVRFTDTNLQSEFSKLGGIAKMAGLEESSITLVGPGAPSNYPAGSAVKVKFRLPLFRRAYYFEIPSSIKRAEKCPDGVKVTAEFGQIADEDRRSIAQFVRDLRLLREEARGGGS